MRRLSIRARLTAWFTGVLAVTLLVFSAVSYILLSYNLWHDLDSTLEGVAKTVAQAARPPMAGIPPDLEQMLRRYFGPSFPERYYQFLDPYGQVDPRFPQEALRPPHISAETLKNAAAGYATFETVEAGGEFPLRVLTFPLKLSGRTTNVLQVGMSLEGLFRTRRNFAWALLAMMPVALALASGGGWLLARRALRPVDRMAETARRIGAEGLGQRLAGAEAEDELGRLARTLNEMLARLEAAFSEMRRFSADASHELRTPLTVLKGEIEVALRSERDSAEYQRVLLSALDEVERMTHLVEDLLLLSRADAGALRFEREPVEMDRLVEDICKQGEILGRPRNVQVSLRSLEPLVVEGDGQKLKQVLLNLVDNAVKYTPAGGHVGIGLRQNAKTPEAAGQAEVLVEDDGVGIPADAIPHLFDRFYRVDPARSRDGSSAGLGLCIAKTIAEAHGGTIEVASALGAGSTFTLRLPLAA
ncbi:MAG TPA: ATP-binding protein [Candidatus Baltobacteraceae bacterium]|nr:ATP-binding protein [Candidatus Baltobacteraceae bacterium]